jgi:hypothetical protein
MPIDARRRDEIAAAVAAYANAHPDVRLPRRTVELLAAMFPTEDVCQRSLDAIAAEGDLDRGRLATFRRKSLAWMEPKLVAGLAKSCRPALTCSVGKQRIAGRQTTQQSNHGFC